jgi:hypothetical protein
MPTFGVAFWPEPMLIFDVHEFLMGERGAVNVAENLIVARVRRGGGQGPRWRGLSTRSDGLERSSDTTAAY